MLWTSVWMSVWMSERCMSHQSDWGYYNQPIKLPLVKVDRVWRFHSDFRTAIFFFFKQRQRQVFLYWPYFDISNASFAMAEPKRVQNSISL